MNNANVWVVPVLSPHALSVISRQYSDRIASSSDTRVMTEPDDEDADERRRRSLAKTALAKAFDRGHTLDFLSAWTVSPRVVLIQ